MKYESFTYDLEMSIQILKIRRMYAFVKVYKATKKFKKPSQTFEVERLCVEKSEKL